MRAFTMSVVLSVGLFMWPSERLVMAESLDQPKDFVQPDEVGKDGLMKFIQLHKSAVAMDSVSDEHPSEVLNRLSAMGRLGLVRSNGFIFSTIGQINPDELPGKTLYITRAVAMAENKSLALALVNSLKRLATSFKDVAGPGCVVIVAPGVRTEKGIVATPEGGAWRTGARVVLAEMGNRLLQYIVTGDAVEQTLGPCGILITLLSTADPVLSLTTRVILGSELLPASRSLVVNQSAITQASRLVTRDGVIHLEGDAALTAHHNPGDSVEHESPETTRLSRGASEPRPEARVVFPAASSN